MQKKRMAALVGLTLLMICLFAMPVYAAGDVASVIEETWKNASGQIKTVVNNVIFPAIDLILAVFFYVKLSTS